MIRKLRRLFRGYGNLQMFADISQYTRSTDHTYIPAKDAIAATATNDMSPEMKTFYDKTLLREAQPNLVHAQFGQKRPIPKNGGRSIEFRRFGALPKATTPLTEGVTPNGSKLSVTTVNAEVDQYGDWVGLTDRIMTEAIDPVMLEATKALGASSGLTADTIVRNHMLMTTNYRWASKWSGDTEIPIEGDDAGRYLLDKTAVLKWDTIEQVATDLRTQNAQKINGSYIAIVHPHSTYELRRDKAWREPHTYADTTPLYNGEIGMIAGVRFIESSEAKVEVAREISDGYRKLTVKTSLGSAGTSLTVNEVLTAGSYAGAKKIPVYINGTENYITAIANNTTYSTLTLEEEVSTTDGASGKIVCGQGGAGDGSPVYSTLVFGANAYGITEIDGEGLKTIVKQLGSGGTEDPLDQRATVGYKLSLTAEILNPRYIVKIESCSPRYANKNLEEN